MESRWHSARSVSGFTSFGAFRREAVHCINLLYLSHKKKEYLVVSFLFIFALRIMGLEWPKAPILSVSSFFASREIPLQTPKTMV